MQENLRRECGINSISYDEGYMDYWFHMQLAQWLAFSSCTCLYIVVHQVVQTCS